MRRTESGTAEQGRRSAQLLSSSSGLGGLAAGIIGPVAIEPGHAPFDALAEAGKAAVLDDRVVHLAHLAVVQHDVGAAIAARNVVGLPGPERGFVDPAIAGDLQRRIPEAAFLLPELGGDGAERSFALLDPAVIAGTGQPEIQLRRIGGLRRLAGSQQAQDDAERGADGGSFQGCEEVAHGESARVPTSGTVPRSPRKVKCNAATPADNSAVGR